VIVIGIVVPVIIAILLLVLTSSKQQHNLDDSDEKLLQRDEIIWQKLQKTYLEQECREKHMGQLDEMKYCFNRIEEEQRLNPPAELRP